MPPNFWTTTNSRFYTERLGSPAPSRRLAVPVVVFVGNEAIVATGPLNNFVMPAIQFVRFSTLTIEGGNRLLVLGP